MGRATVQHLAGRDFDVAGLARGKAGLAGARADVEATGQRSLAIDVDVFDHRAVTDAAAKIERELGEIDAWVNVAFVGTLAFAWDTSPEEYRRVMDVTFNGQVHGTLAALSFTRPRNLGTIVKVCSAMSYRSIPPKPLCAGTHAVKGFTESVMTELAHEKSKVKLCMSNCPDSTLHSSTGTSTRCRSTRCPCLPSSRQSWRPRGSCTGSNTRAATSGLGCPSAGPSTLNRGTGGSPRRVQDVRVPLRLAC